MRNYLQLAAIIILAGLSAYLLFGKFKGGPHEDGNPIGFDLRTTETTGYSIAGNLKNGCLDKTSCFVQIRYLTTVVPVPTCVSTTTEGCPPNATATTPRQLPDCSSQPTAICITLTSPAYAQHQDDDGLHPATVKPYQQQTRILISPTYIPAK